MRKIFAKMWNDDAGIVAFEYLLVATIVGLALVVGLAAVSNALNAEFSELATAILALNQSYSYAAQSTCVSNSGGMSFTDTAAGTVSYGHTNVAAFGAQISSADFSVCP